ncbi:MAG: 30S ribosomal protein S4 [Elusimicrobiota bacterium]
MARYLGSVCRICRREGTKLFLKGKKCSTFKCALEKRNIVPGQHGPTKKNKKLSEYGTQLREKQKTKRQAGLLENQFKRYFEKAEKKQGITGENLLIFLERRLDNVVYKLGFVSSKLLSRQLIVHRHFMINGRVLDRPSYLVKEGDVITVREKSQEKQIFKLRKEEKEQKTLSGWLEFNAANLEGKILRLPLRQDIDAPINEQLIVELYSK